MGLAESTGQVCTSTSLTGCLQFTALTVSVSQMLSIVALQFIYNENRTKVHNCQRCVK